MEKSAQQYEVKVNTQDKDTLYIISVKKKDVLIPNNYIVNIKKIYNDASHNNFVLLKKLDKLLFFYKLTRAKLLYLITLWIV